MNDLWNAIYRERPVGSESNAAILEYLENQFEEMGLNVTSLPFSCLRWEEGLSHVEGAGQTLTIQPSPYSTGFWGEREMVMAETHMELKQVDCKDRVLVMAGKLTESPLMPKDYPFYYPDEHRRMIELLEEKSPAAVIALTGRHPMCGLDPFPLFEDGRLGIPTAYASLSDWTRWKQMNGERGRIVIDSQVKEVESRQLVAEIKGRNPLEKVVIGAHMDTKYKTPGALDNAAGIAVLMEAARMISSGEYSVDIVPFNGEEYFAASGEIAYLEYLKRRGDSVRLMVNVDAPCFQQSPDAVSFYNLKEETIQTLRQLVESHPQMVVGESWYAGDHSAFAFSGTPCLAVTTSDLDRALMLTHTALDTEDLIRRDGFQATAAAVVEMIDACTAKR